MLATPGASIASYPEPGYEASANNYYTVMNESLNFVSQLAANKLYAKFSTLTLSLRWDKDAISPHTCTVQLL